MNPPPDNPAVMPLEEVIATCAHLQNNSGPQLGQVFAAVLHHLEAGKRDSQILDLLETQDGIGINHEGYGDYSYYANDANWPKLRVVAGQLLDGTHYTQPQPKGEA